MSRVFLLLIRCHMPRPSTLIKQLIKMKANLEHNCLRFVVWLAPRWSWIFQCASGTGPAVTLARRKRLEGEEALRLSVLWHTWRISSRGKFGVKVVLLRPRVCVVWLTSCIQLSRLFGSYSKCLEQSPSMEQTKPSWHSLSPFVYSSVYFSFCLSLSPGNLAFPCFTCH